jgi:secreted Zn-dependent insulinase-like peptidase
MNKIIEIEKPKFDNRIFNGGQLENGIKFSIVNDHHLTKSFVTVCLNTGSFSDPVGYEGLAHFLEHMLFMGSKKYPDENHYNTRLNELGGNSNAYTDVMETVYYFNVYDNGLEEIFDIFSRFFIDPSFDPDSISREINAVNSEHNKNINQDMWRKYQLMLNLTDKDSTVNTFVTGSLNSLQKKDIREQVIKFYKKYYTTGNISISIASSKPTYELYDIIEKTFGHIPKKSEDSNDFSLTKPFITENKGKTFHLKSIANIYEINWIWEIPYQGSFLDSKDFDILEIMITNKSDKSIYFHLKNKGFLHSISVEIRHEGIFNINLRLTKEGYSNMGYVEAVLLDGLNKIIKGDLKKIADYYKQINQINFDCINKIDSEDLCNMLAVNHHYQSTPKIFSGIYLISEIKSTQEYHDLFTKYLNINNCMKIISAQDYNQNKFVYNILPEYLAEYSQVPNEFSTDSTYKVDDTLCLFQTTNEYLNSEIKLIKDLDKFDVPKLISERQWYGGCSKFGEPIVQLLLHFNSNKFFNSPKSYILSNISCSILNFLATVILYKSSELCYSISFVPNPTTSSISIKISGLNNVNNLKRLLCNVNDFIINIDKLFDKVSKTYVNNLIISFKESYQNTKYLNPWEYSTYIIRNQQISTEYPSEEIIRELELINYDSIKDYLSKILEGVALTTCVYGNIESTQLSGLFNNFSKLFEKTNYSLPKINQLTKTMISHPNSQEKSNCITLYYPIGKFLPKESNLISLTTNILSQHFFDNLRTSHQLGYLVRMGQTSIRDEQYIIQKIQSEKPIDFVESKIDLFNKQIFKIIESADFDKFVSTLESKLKEPDYSLDEKFMRYYPEISFRQYLFNRNDILLKQLTELTKDDLVEFIKKFINNDNKNKIIINGN